MNKITRMFSVLLLAMLVALPFKAAFAASLTVSIRQVSPNGAAQTVTCADMQQKCFLPLAVNAGQPTAQSLNIHVGYISGRLFLTFQAPVGYFYAGDTGGKNGFYSALWVKPVSGSTTYDITLVQTSVQDYLKTPILDIAHVAHPSVANLEVTATPSP